VRKGSGLATDERRDLNRGTNNDLIVTDVKARGEKMKRGINIYDQRDVRTRERPARIMNSSRIIRQRGGGTILAGDFNAQSCRSDARFKEQHAATFWEEIIDEHGLEIGNHEKPTHHGARNGEEGESTIDLTLAS
jgi:endonuclease/exonuclease/phosphatase (EEP) superfamily protein YafD